jgi:hypothetical protein
MHLCIYYAHKHLSLPDILTDAEIPAVPHTTQKEYTTLTNVLYTTLTNVLYTTLTNVLCMMYFDRCRGSHGHADHWHPKDQEAYVQPPPAECHTRC